MTAGINMALALIEEDLSREMLGRMLGWQPKVP